MADYLNNRKRHELARLEQDGKMMVQIIGAEELRRSTWWSNAATATIGK